MFELWCKRSYFLAERELYRPKKTRDNYSDFRTLSGTVNSILYALYVAISDEDVATCICLLFGGQSTILEAFWKQKKLASSVSCWIIYNITNFICPREIKKFRIVVYQNWRLILNIIGLKVTTLICVLLL